MEDKIKRVENVLSCENLSYVNLREEGGRPGLG
jgi:hypothetical protein